MSMDFYSVVRTLQFDDRLACNSAPSEGFTLPKEELDCLNPSCLLCLDCFNVDQQKRPRPIKDMPSLRSVQATTAT
jgi:hypothetical protein